jgi:hypothetical protein
MFASRKRNQLFFIFWMVRAARSHDLDAVVIETTEPHAVARSDLERTPDLHGNSHLSLARYLRAVL